MGELLNELIDLLNKIITRLEKKEDRTAEETLLLSDAKTKLAIAQSLKSSPTPQ